MPIIEIDNLVKEYSRGGVRAVDGVSLEVTEGEIFGFLGPNGAGKTTMVRIMTTLLSLTSGRVVVAGHDVTTNPSAVRMSIGAALQEIGLDGMSTAREFLELQATIFAVADPRGRAAELLEVVGLADAADRTVRTFSGGMKRRLDLAAALVHKPQVLFLDEPTTGLDPASRSNVWEEVRRLQKAGTTIFLTTQYLEEADALCERLAIIDHGRIVAEGSPERLKSEVAEDVVTVLVEDADREKAEAVIRDAGREATPDPMSGALQIAVDNGASAVPEVVRRFENAGISVREISLRRPTLDDVFLTATGNRLEGASAAAEAAPPTDQPNGRPARRGRRSAQKVSR